MTVAYDHRGSTPQSASNTALEDRFEVLKDIGDGRYDYAHTLSLGEILIYFTALAASPSPESAVLAPMLLDVVLSLPSRR